MSGSMTKAGLTMAEYRSQTLGEGAEVTVQGALIFRLHTEILQLIFELMVFASPSSTRIQTAILLSGVCRRWRRIAVDTPTIWAKFEVVSGRNVFFDDSPIIKLAILRIKAAPAMVGIRRIDTSGLVHNEPRHWPFFQLANLSDLTMLFGEHGSLAQFANAGLNALRYPPLRHLSIGTHQSRHYLPPVDLLGLGEIFPNLSHLTILNLRVAEVRRGHTLWHSLKYCDIQLASISLGTIVTAFPGLEHLQMSNTLLERSTQSYNARKLPTMQHLKIEDSFLFHDPELSFISYPNLISLYNAATSSDKLIEFICRHSSLKHLDCFLTDLHVAACARAAPQLTHVCLTTSIEPFVHWWNYGLASPPFPHLETLLLGDYVTPFTDAEFEALVRVRFLPIGHPQSLLDDESTYVKELRIIRKENANWGAESWANHPLCLEAKVAVMRYKEETGINYISLRWV